MLELSGIETMPLYFAYGSNMDAERLGKRVDQVKVTGVGSVTGYDLRFNKRSVDGSGKANLVERADAVVEGVLFEVSAAQLERLDGFEKGYHRMPVSVVVNGATQSAITYVADPDQIDDSLTPTTEYLRLIRRGAEAFGLSDAYRQRLCD
jgi:gamma-glutamylcyclotransferase